MLVQDTGETDTCFHGWRWRRGGGEGNAGSFWNVARKLISSCHSETSRLSSLMGVRLKSQDTGLGLSCVRLRKARFKGFASILGSFRLLVYLDAD